MTTIKPHLAPDPILPLSPSIYGSEATSFYAFKSNDNQNNLNKNDNINLTASYFLTKTSNLNSNLNDELECGIPRRNWVNF